MDQPRGDPVEQISHARRLARLEVHVVDEDQEDAARSVVRGAWRRQHEAFARRGGRLRDVEHAPAM